MKYYQMTVKRFARHLLTEITVTDDRSDKPLFIPLKKEWYVLFDTGLKNIEYRQYGKRWNLATCYTGRKVVLSCGYGKHHRRNGVIAGSRITTDPPDFVRKIYPTGAIICINIKVTR